MSKEPKESNTDMQTVNVGITGKGVAARLHKPVLEGIPYVKVTPVHLSDPSDKLKPSEDDVRLQPLDLLIIGTPTYKHISHIEYSLPYCPMILCEKPVGYSLEQVLKLHHSVKNEGRTVFVNFQLRYVPQIQTLGRFIRNAGIQAMTLEYRSSARVDKNLPEWYRDPERGGGVVYSVLPHLIELLHYYKLNIDTLYSVQSNTGYPLGNSIPMDDIEIHGVTANGVLLNVSINTREKFDRFIATLNIDNQEVKFDLISGTIWRSPFNSQAYSYSAGVLASGNEGIWRNGLRELLRVLLIETYSRNIISDLPTLSEAVSVHDTLSKVLKKYKS